MKTHPGVAAATFEALSEAGVNIEMISTSTIRISVVVRRRTSRPPSVRCMSASALTRRWTA
jgi:aspartokinase